MCLFNSGLEALREKLERSEARAEALNEQLKSIPESLLVAQAEKRVTEAKMERLREDYGIFYTRNFL